MIRLLNDGAIILAYSYNVRTRITTGIILRTDEADMTAIKDNLMHYKELAGHELLLRAVMTEISLKASKAYLSSIKQDIMDVEHSTGQHTWVNYIAKNEEPKSDAELSRIAHGLRIQIAAVNRKVDVISIWLELLLQGLSRGDRKAADRRRMPEWLDNMKTQHKMTRLDVDLLAKRAENQVGAVCQTPSPPLQTSDECSLKNA